ncbi:MAG: tripartite tricarboxylate transporter substrate binding protein [Actinobacteria bacterium]|nr:tripartite tricarboxylate transporter substrate binding protein [Actinomycetota bacterium]
MPKRTSRLLAVSLVFVLVVLVITGCAQKAGESTKQETKKPEPVKFPTKPITVIQGFKPGGGSDQLAQMIQPRLEKILGQSFVNVYKPGATGAIAWNELATSTKNDGYTISITNTPMLQANYLLNPEHKYTVDMLEPIANIVTDPGVLVVKADGPLKTWKDFVDKAKENSGKVSVGNSGVGGDDYFNVILIEKLAGIKLNSVPFEGDGPSWQAALGGQIDASSNNLAITYPMLKAGKLRALAVYSDKRVPMLPDVPTLKELGINVVGGSSRGYSAPKGTPKEIIDILANAMEKVVNDPEFKKSAQELSVVIDFKKTDGYKSYLKTDETRMKQIIEEQKGKKQ